MRPGARSIVPSGSCDLNAGLRAGDSLPMPRANASARSFSGWPEWPATQRHAIWWRAISCIQQPPEILVLDRLLVGGLPALGFPAVEPLRGAVHHIAGIGMDGDGEAA